MASKESGSDRKKRLQPKTSMWTSRPALYIFSVIVLAIIVVSFVGGPIVGQIAGPSASIEFGRYRGRPIELAQGTYFQNQLTQLQEQFGRPGNVSEMFQIYRMGFERALLHTAIMMEAEDSGMTVSSSRVTERIVELPRFRDGTGVNRQALSDLTAEERMNLRQTMRENLVHDKYIQDILTGFDYSDAEISFFANQGSIERRFRIARFALDAVPDEEIAGFGTQNAELFRHLDLSSVVVGPDREQAEQILALYRDGDDTFENLAEEFSIHEESAQQRGERGRMYRHELEREILEPQDVDRLFETAEGEVTDLIDTQTGYAFFRVDAAATDPDFEDDEMLAEVRAYMEEFERGTLEDHMFGQAEDFAFTVRDGAGFEETGEAYPARLTETSFFPINFGNQPYLPAVETIDGEGLSDAQSRESFFRSAFSISDGEVTDPIVLRDYVVVLELIEERESDPTESEMIAQIVPQLFRQYQAQEVERSLLDPSHIEDNFAAVFSRHFLQPQRQQTGETAR